jgi:hypothetical protein
MGESFASAFFECNIVSNNDCCSASTAIVERHVHPVAPPTAITEEYGGTQAKHSSATEVK